MSVSQSSLQPSCSADASPSVDGSEHSISLPLTGMSGTTSNGSSPEPKSKIVPTLGLPESDLRAKEDHLSSPLVSTHGLESFSAQASTSSMSEPGPLDTFTSHCGSPAYSTSEKSLILPRVDTGEVGSHMQPTGSLHCEYSETDFADSDSMRPQIPEDRPPPMWSPENLGGPSTELILNGFGEGSSQEMHLPTPGNLESRLDPEDSLRDKTPVRSPLELETLSNTILPPSDVEDAYMESNYEEHNEPSHECHIGRDSDTDGTDDEEVQEDTLPGHHQSPNTSVNSDLPSNVLQSDVNHEEQESPLDSGASGNDGIFELIQTEGNLLADFDFDAFLSVPDSMDLDNPIFGIDPNIQPPAVNNALNAVPQVLFPPHMQPVTQQWLMNHPNLPFGIFQDNGAGFFAFTTATEDDAPEWPGPQHYGEYERNLSFADFCSLLSSKYRQDPSENARFRINSDHLDIVNFHLPAEVDRDDIDETQPDYQGIPWPQLDIERHRCRMLRNEKYSNYANMKPYPEPRRVIRRFVPVNDNFFRFRKTCNTVDVRFSHFQLRNVVSAVSKNDVYYTEDSAVVRIDPQTNKTDVIMDFRKQYSGDPIKITTLASDYGVIIAGGFYGEYAMKSLDSPLISKPVQGLVTTDNNGITNHVHFYKSRTTGTPRAVFSSNDEKLRTLDCYSNRMVSEYKLPWAINCSATSPDGRLRVIVGDAKEVVIQGVDDGETIHSLPGHVDFGFACAWSDDGHTIATGNQDMMVRVYDARNFKREIAVLDADIAGARSLRFSPVGSGPRVLAWAEPADMVSIIDAVTWESRQRIDFFGEIAGISFTPDGRELYIANSDKTVGGLMQFERWKTGVSGHVYDSPSETGASEHPISRRRMRLRDVNMDFLGVF